MKVKSGYKQTEVGVIPEDWKVRRIGALSKLINGRGFKPYEWQTTGLPIIRIQNLNGSDDFNFYTGPYDRKLEVEPGQLLFAWSGSRGTSFGPHIWQGPLGLLNYHTWKVQIQESEVDKEFFLHALRQLTAFIEGKAHGASALVHTQKWEMEDFQLPLPPTKTEQEAIAEALSDADALIESLEQLLTKKRHLKQGAMQELLTGKKRLPGFSGEWGSVRLRDLLSYERPDRYIVHDTEYSEQGDIPVLTANKSFVLGYTVEDFGICNDLPVIIFDDFTTASKYADFRFKVKSSAIKLLRPKHNQVDLRFVFDRMQLIHFPLGDHKRYYISEFQNLEVAIPDYAEQQAIATILSDMDTEITALKTKLTKARQVKQGMMQELLTGRIRLV